MSRDVVATFMLDFPWSMSCVVELCAISRLAPGGLVVTISLVRKFSAWMLSLVRMQTSRQLTKRSLRTELLDLLARLAL